MTNRRALMKLFNKQSISVFEKCLIKILFSLQPLYLMITNFLLFHLIKIDST